MTVYEYDDCLSLSDAVAMNKISEETKVHIESHYCHYGCFSEGLCRVNIWWTGSPEEAYSYDDEGQGMWGFVNEKGDEAILPQYKYVYDFNHGVAIACTSEWTTDSKEINGGIASGNWAGKDFWGIIDRNGNEVIPFLYDEIKHMNETNDILMVHTGGWEEGHWGVMDKTGKWIAEPIFGQIDYDYWNGLFAFMEYPEAICGIAPWGIYDTKQQRVIFKPQFTDVVFRDDVCEVTWETDGIKQKGFIDADGNLSSVIR
jgi:hypothetical protein